MPHERGKLLLPIVRKVDGWTSRTVRGCLEGMGELDDNPDVLLQADPSEDPTDETYVYEQSIYWLACTLASEAVLPPAFQYIPSMVASYD